MIYNTRPGVRKIKPAAKDSLESCDLFRYSYFLLPVCDKCVAHILSSCLNHAEMALSYQYSPVFISVSDN